MFNFQVKDRALATCVAGCAIAGYAVAGTDYVEELPALVECSDVQPSTMKCAMVGVAIAGYAHAGWKMCACTDSRWLEQDTSNFNMPLNECDEDD